MTTRGPLDVRFPSRSGPLDAREGDGIFHDRLRRAESIGRPLGSAAFLEKIADMPGRPVGPGKRGPKPIQLKGGIKCNVTVMLHAAVMRVTVMCKVIRSGHSGRPAFARSLVKRSR